MQVAFHKTVMLMSFLILITGYHYHHPHCSLRARAAGVAVEGVAEGVRRDDLLVADLTGHDGRSAAEEVSLY